jgi:uncharacterized protein (TIGR02246 family)
VALTFHFSNHFCPLLVIFSALALAGCAHRSPSCPLRTEQAIRQVLNRQVEAWNRGDIEAFMEAYVRTEQLRFTGASGVKRGWDQTLTRYRDTYPDRAAMGTVSFEDLEITLLSSRYAEVFGRYCLRRGGTYADASGFFTLLLEKTRQGWRVVHDHSSALQEK